MSKLTLTDINTLMGEYEDTALLPEEALVCWACYEATRVQVETLPLDVALLESEEWQRFAHALEQWRVWCVGHQAELLAAFEAAQSAPAGDVW